MRIREVNNLLNTYDYDDYNKFKQESHSTNYSLYAIANNKL